MRGSLFLLRGNVKFQFVVLFESAVGNAVPSVPKRFRGFDAP